VHKSGPGYFRGSGSSYQAAPHVRRESVLRADVVRLVCDVQSCNMNRKELEIELESLLLKKARLRKTTKREELILAYTPWRTRLGVHALAYTHYAAGCSTCYATMKVQR
jgi:hypothetical protein